MTINLYESRKKIYVRSIKGLYRTLRDVFAWTFFVFYFLLPWLSWNNKPIILFDLPKRQFHVLDITFWPQDFMLLTWFLVIAAFALFFFTTLSGRVFCGYVCPQSVWTHAFMWFEKITEGNRNKRVRLDSESFSANKLLKKLFKHSMWLGFSFLTGFTFIAYFFTGEKLLVNILDLNLNLWAVFWICFFSVATYVNAGWLREQVCFYMCPYARFQAAMFDKDTLTVSYDKDRGEPRGKRKKNVQASSLNLGDCINCDVCVQVCPTGIDIRDGLQYECINCGLCVDGCNTVMDKMGYPRGLISYATENKLKKLPFKILRPKLIGYACALIIMILVFSYTLLDRVPLQLDVIRDRKSLYQITQDGFIANSYLLKVINMTQKPQSYKLSVKTKNGLELVYIGKDELYLEAGEILQIPVRLKAVIMNKKTNNKILFVIKWLDKSNTSYTTISSFIGNVSRK